MCGAAAVRQRLLRPPPERRPLALADRHQSCRGLAALAAVALSNRAAACVQASTPSCDRACSQKLLEGVILLEGPPGPIWRGPP